MNIKFTFTPTPQDYSLTVRHMQLHRWQNWVSLGILLASSLMSLCVLSSGQGSNIIPILIVLAFPAFAAYLFIYQPYTIGRMAAQNERLCSLTTWEAGEKEIHVSNAFNQSKTAWEEFKKAEETAGYFLLVPAGKGGFYRFVPRRAFTSPEQEASFRELLGRKLPARPRS